MKKAIPTLNVRLLRRVQKHIMAEPRRINMSTWTEMIDPKLPHYADEPPCNTVGCIAGWALMLDGMTPRRVTNLTERNNGLTEIALKGAKLLGLPKPRTYAKAWWWPAMKDIDRDSLAAAVFFTESWPEPFKSSYEDLDMERDEIETALCDERSLEYQKARKAAAVKLRRLRVKEAKLVCKRIDHLIAKGE